jgi:hypothetical protein
LHPDLDGRLPGQPPHKGCHAGIAGFRRWLHNAYPQAAAPGGNITDQRSHGLEAVIVGLWS